MPVLSHHLRQVRAAHPRLTEELAALLVEIGLAGKIIAREVAGAALTGRLGYTGETNVQGEEVKQLDRWANEAMVDVLARSGLVCTMVSEEMEKPLHLDEACAASRYLVCFDPVDGSSNTDINGIVGTIFGIRPSRGGGGPGHTGDALGPGTAQVAAGYVMYGPATVLVYTAGHGVHGLTLDTMTGEYVLTHPDLRIPPRGKTYSVNEGNWHRWGTAPRDYITSLSSVTDGARPYSLRYVGSLVADFHRTLLEGGIYLYPAEVGGTRATGKLRLLYEAAPLALVAEQAGGRASTGTERILEVVAGDYHQRVPLLIGSPEEVARAESFHQKEQT
jgi:fructose-1,6-bisphosphatase I